MSACIIEYLKKDWRDWCIRFRTQTKIWHEILARWFHTPISWGFSSVGGRGEPAIREKQIGPMHSYFNRLGLVGRKNVLDIWEILQKIETIMTIDKTWLMEWETALHARFQHDRECPRMTHRRRRGWTSHFHCRGQENSSLSLPPTIEDCDSALRRHGVRHH